MNKRVHLIGIGGIGMSALARWFLAKGYAVTGSDIEKSEITDALRSEGVSISLRHNPKNVQGNIEQVISSAAITPTAQGYNEFRAAKKRGIETLTYSEALALISSEYTAIAVAGAHGKSTTTALLSLVLARAGFDPTVVIGTTLQEFGNSNFRLGRSNVCVIEADEHNAAFLNYRPSAAIITNIDREHLDFYKNLAGVKESFLQFIKNIKRNGILVLNKDDRNVYGMKKQIERRAKTANIRVYWYGISSRSPVLDNLRAVLKIPGDHNLGNALTAYTMAAALGAKKKDILLALGKYKGAWRRMEYRGTMRVSSIKYQVSRRNDKRQLPATSYQLPVYDDYAHHPSEIKATLAGIAQKWPKSAIICVFQPHQAKRLALLFEDFVKAFDQATFLILLDLYRVPGRDKASKINSKTLANAVQKRILTGSRRLATNNFKLQTAMHLPSPTRIRSVIETQIRNSKFEIRNPIIVMMGAGDIYKYTAALVK